MPERSDGRIVYHRSKGDAAGAMVIGCVLLVIAVPAMTMDSIGGIGFSRDMVMMSTYLALPLGVVLVLVNIRHLLTRGPTLLANKEGITILFTDPPAGPLHWAEIREFRSFWHQGKRHLGIGFGDPAQSLSPYMRSVAALVRRKGPKRAHLKIDGKMLDSNIKTVVSELEEMRQIHSWRTR